MGSSFLCRQVLGFHDAELLTLVVHISIERMICVAELSVGDGSNRHHGLKLVGIHRDTIVIAKIGDVLNPLQAATEGIVTGHRAKFMVHHFLDLHNITSIR